MDGWVWSNGWMILTGENWSIGRKTRPGVTYAATNLPVVALTTCLYQISRRCFPFNPATRPAAMRCGLWLAHLLMLRAITSAVRMRDVLLAFVQDLVHLQHWRVVALVYCAGRSVHRQWPALMQATFWRSNVPAADLTTRNITSKRVT